MNKLTNTLIKQVSLLVILCFALNVSAQTNPTPHDLSASALTYDFQAVVTPESTSYPASIQGWSSVKRYITANGAPAPTDFTIDGDEAFGGGPTGNAIRPTNARGISIQNTQDAAMESFPLGLVAAVNTKGLAKISVGFRIIGFVDESPSSTHLMYRTSTDSAFKEIPAGRFRAASAGVGLFVNVSVFLPADAADKENVQILFLYTTELPDKQAPLPGTAGAEIELRTLSIVGAALSHPTPYILANKDFLFDGITDPSSTKYPTFMQGWNGPTTPVVNGSGNYPTTDIEQFNADLRDNSAPNNGTSIRNDGEAGISIQSNVSASTPQSFVVAISTIGAKGIEISWKGKSVFSFVDVSSTVQLQYRIGTTAKWTNLASHEYLNANQGTSPEAKLGPTLLPDSLEEQAMVEFRWIHFTQTGGGNSNRTAIDSIVITAAEKETQLPIADFSVNNRVTQAQIPISFEDLSAGSPDSYSWDFGDGTNSDKKNPTKVYEQDGLYTVSLIITNAAGADTMTKVDYIQVGNPSSVKNNTKNTALKLYPNPVTNNLSIQSNLEVTSIAVYNVLGEKVLEKNNANIKSIDVSSLSTGAYFIKVRNVNNDINTQRFIKK